MSCGAKQRAIRAHGVVPSGTVMGVLHPEHRLLVELGWLWEGPPQFWCCRGPAAVPAQTKMVQSNVRGWEGDQSQLLSLCVSPLHGGTSMLWPPCP